MTATCGAPVRGFPGETCGLDAGHRGYHSCVTYVCDGCGARRRGQPSGHAQDGAPGEGYLLFCFMCVHVPRFYLPKPHTTDPREAA